MALLVYASSKNATRFAQFFFTAHPSPTVVAVAFVVVTVSVVAALIGADFYKQHQRRN